MVGEGSFLLRLRSTVCGEHSVVSQDSVYKAIVLLPYAPKVIRGANVCKPNSRGFYMRNWTVSRPCRDVKNYLHKLY